MDTDMKRKDSRGISVIFAVIYVAIGAVLIIGTLRLSGEVQKRMTSSRASLEAEDVTSSAITLALEEVKKHGPGWEGNGTHEVEIEIQAWIWGLVKEAYAKGPLTASGLLAQKALPAPKVIPNPAKDGAAADPAPAKDGAADPKAVDEEPAAEDAKDPAPDAGGAKLADPNAGAVKEPAKEGPAVAPKADGVIDGPAPKVEPVKDEEAAAPVNDAGRAGEDKAGQEPGPGGRPREVRTLTATWDVQARPDKVFGGAADFNDYYSVPNIGTGNAGTDCLAQRAPIADPDHPCNWNKLTASEPAAIPLYVTITDPVTGEDTSVNPWKDQDAAQLKIRMRTPCTPDENGREREECEPEDRYELDVDANDLVNTDQTIVYWEVLGICANGRNCSLLANTARDRETKIRENRAGKQNTEITEYRINVMRDASPDAHVVLFQDGDYSLGWLNANPQNEQTLLEFLQSVDEPVLQLRQLHSLKDIDGNRVPYLEYQIVTADILTLPDPRDQNRITAGITDLYTTIKAKGFSGKHFKNFIKRIVSKKYVRSGFVLQ